MAIQQIYHFNCPWMGKDDEAPKFVWDGFYMAGVSGFVCERCKTCIMLEDETDNEVIRRVQEKNRKNRKNRENRENRKNGTD